MYFTAAASPHLIATLEVSNGSDPDEHVQHLSSQHTKSAVHEIVSLCCVLWRRCEGHRTESDGERYRKLPIVPSLAAGLAS